MKINLKKNKGITLIALVITIIVLLILAGVTIATLTGDNGILTRASEASKESEITSVKEQAQLDITNWIAGELENGRNAKVNTPEKVKEILDSTNQNNGNKYYNGYTDTGVKTPSGYEVPFEELYIGEPITEVSEINYGDRVNYVAKGDDSLIWRIFYDDENYVYLISSKADGGNVIDSYNFSDFPGSSKTYVGSDDIQDSFLQSLNSQWFEVLGNIPNTNNSAKAIAYLMDQEVWDKYKDSEGKASYAIGGPTLELFVNSYNKSEETVYDIEITGCNDTGYSSWNSTSGSVYNWLEECNHDIYNNGENYWLASTGDGNHLSIWQSNSGGGNIWSGMITVHTAGLRPVVIIPKSNFTYQIIEESE